MWVSNNFIADILFLSVIVYNVISLIGLKITLQLCLLLSFLQNRIPCKHNVWADDNLALRDVHFLSIMV